MISLTLIRERVSNRHGSKEDYAFGNIRRDGSGWMEQPKGAGEGEGKWIN